MQLLFHARPETYVYDISKQVEAVNVGTVDIISTLKLLRIPKHLTREIIEIIET